MAKREWRMARNIVCGKLAFTHWNKGSQNTIESLGKEWPSKWFRFWFRESQPWVTNEGDSSLILPEGSLACSLALGKAGRQIHVKFGLRVPREDLSPFWTFKESLCLHFIYHEVQRWLTHRLQGLLQDTVSPIRRAVSHQEPRVRERTYFLGLREEAGFTVLGKGRLPCYWFLSFQIWEYESVNKTLKVAQSAVMWLSLSKYPLKGRLFFLLKRLPNLSESSSLLFRLDVLSHEEGEYLLGSYI